MDIEDAKQTLESHGWDIPEIDEGETGILCAEETSGRKHSLLIRPNADEPGGDISLYEYVGSGSTPMDIYNGQGVSIGVPQNAHGPDVLRLLANNIEELDRLSDAYQGTEWDGSNHVGVWDEPPKRHAGGPRELMSRSLYHTLRDETRKEWSTREFLDWWAHGGTEFGADVARLVVEDGLTPEDAADKLVSEVDGEIIVGRVGEATELMLDIVETDGFDDPDAAGYVLLACKRLGIDCEFLSDDAEDVAIREAFIEEWGGSEWVSENMTGEIVCTGCDDYDALAVVVDGDNLYSETLSVDFVEGV